MLTWGGTPHPGQAAGCDTQDNVACEDAKSIPHEATG
jgi:hypothetical protein